MPVHLRELLGSDAPEVRRHGPTGSPDPDEKVAPARKRIMVVEDEAITALYLEQMLEELGYEVCALAASAPQAVAAAEHSHPDLVLMDIRLAEGTDGVQAAHEIRSRYGTPSIYITAHTDALTLERARSTDPLGFLTKPYSKQELALTLQQAFGRLSRH